MRTLIRPSYDDLERDHALALATLRELLRLLAAAETCPVCVVDLDEQHGVEWAHALRRARSVVGRVP